MQSAWHPTEFVQDPGCPANNGQTAVGVPTKAWCADQQLQYGASNATDSQKWQLQKTSDGYFRIMNRATGRVFSTTNQKSWAEVEMYNGSYASQEWTLSQNNGYVQFVNRWDGSMLGDQDQNGTVERNGSAGASSFQLDRDTCGGLPDPEPMEADGVRLRKQWSREV